MTKAGRLMMSLLVCTLLSGNTIGFSDWSSRTEVDHDEADTTVVNLTVVAPDYTHKLNEISGKLDKETYEFEATLVASVNAMANNPSDYIVSSEEISKTLGPRLGVTDVIEYPMTERKEPYVGNIVTSHGQRISSLIRGNMLHRDYRIATNTNSISIQKSSRYDNPKEPFYMSDLYMSMAKKYVGVLGSRPLLIQTQSIRDFGSGLSVVKSTGSVPVIDYPYRDQLGNNVDQSLSNLSVSYPYGDSFLYTYPNVYELYYKELLLAGAISLNTFDRSKQSYTDLVNITSTNDMVPRWDNTLKTLDVSVIPSNFYRAGSVDAPNVGRYVQYKAISGSKPFGQSGVYGSSTTNYNSNVPTNLEVKSINRVDNFSFTATEPGMLLGELSTIGEAYVAIANTMRAYEGVLTQAEIDYIKFAFGANYTASTRYTEAIDYLIAKGVINPEDESEVNNIHLQLTNEYATKLLVRVSDEKYRYTFKKVQMSASDQFFKDRGFGKNAIGVSFYGDNSVPILSNTPVNVVDPVELDMNSRDVAFPIEFVIKLTESQIINSNPKFIHEDDWYLTVQSDWAVNHGVRDTDYTYTYGNNTIVYRLTDNYYSYLKTIGGGQSLEVNSPRPQDKPVYITGLDSPGEYTVSGSSKGADYWVATKSRVSYIEPILKSFLAYPSFAESILSTETVEGVHKYSLGTNVKAPLTNYTYKPTGESLDMHSTIDGVDVVPNGKDTYTVTVVVNATSQVEAANILRKLVVPKGSGESFKLSGYTREGTTLIHESELSRLGIIQKSDKLLYSTRTGTSLLFPEGLDYVYAGAQVLKFPSGTTYYETEGGNLYYNLDAIVSILGYSRDVVQLYGNSQLSITDTPRDTEASVYTKDSGYLLDKTMKIARPKLEDQNLYSVSHLNMATNSLTLVDVEEGYSIFMKLELTASTNEVDSLLDKNDLSYLFQPPLDNKADRTLSSKNMRWNELHNNFVQELIPRYSSDNYYFKPSFTLLYGDDESKKKGSTYLKHVLGDLSDEDYDSYVTTRDLTDYTTSSEYYMLPNNALFVSPKILDYVWDVGKGKLVYIPKFQFDTVVDRLSSVPQKTVLHYETDSMTDWIVTMSGANSDTSIEAVGLHKTLKSKFDPIAVSQSLQARLTTESISAGHKVGITSVSVGGNVQKLEDNEYLYSAGKFYGRDKQFFPTKEFGNSGFLRVSDMFVGGLFSEYAYYVEENSIPPNATVYYADIVTIPNNGASVDDKKTIVSIPILPEVDFTLFNGNIVSQVIASVDKLSITDENKVPYNSIVYFGNIATVKRKGINGDEYTFIRSLPQPKVVTPLNKQIFTDELDGILSSISPTLVLPGTKDLIGLQYSTIRPRGEDMVGVFHINGENEMNVDGEALDIVRTINHLSMTLQVRDEPNSPFYVTSLPSSTGTPMFKAYGYSIGGFGTNVQNANVLLGTSLNVDRKIVSYGIGEGGNVLSLDNPEEARSNLKESIQEIDMNTSVFYLKMSILVYLIWAWVISFGLKAHFSTSRKSILFEIQDRWGVDLIKIASVGLWSANSNFSMTVVLGKMFLSLVLIQIILQI